MTTIASNAATAAFAPRDRLDGQVVVITGAAGAIGAASAHRFAALGARLALIQREGHDRVLRELPGNGHFVIEASVTDSARLRDVAAQVERTLGRAAILVNAAGWTKPVAAGELDALTDDLIDDMFAVNWRGTFAPIRAFASQLKADGDGLIVNLSSIAGLSGLGSNLAYAAAKAGIDASTKALAKSLAPAIRVLAVSPGLLATGFVPGRDASFYDRAAASLPLRRVGTADDIAAAIVACATLLRYATGSVFVVDGGRHLG